MQTQTIHYIPPVAKSSGLIRVAAYARVSSDSLDQLESYAAQVEHYTQLIANHPGWELVDIYADEGLTGTRADTRVEFQRMLKDCRRGRIDKVLTKSISRFARNTRDTLTSIRELKALGVEVFFEKERLDTGAMSSELMLSFYGAAAQEESLSISGNMRWSYQRRMKSGEFITCSAPYGYRLVGNQLVINDYQTKIIRFIFDSYLSGNGTPSIAGILSERGIPAPRGAAEWQKSTVCGILSNEKYVGEALLQKSYTTNEIPFVRKNNNGERTMYHVTDSHVPIIQHEVFEMVAQLRKRRVDQYTRARDTHIYPFSHMITCGECGHNFRRKTCCDKAYWVCYNHFLNKDNCPIKQIPEPVIEQVFIHLYQKLRKHRHDILTPMLEQLTTLRQRAAFRLGQITDIDNEILRLGRQSMLLHRLHSAGHMEAAYYYEQTQELNSKVSALRRKRQLLVDDQCDDDSVERTQELLDVLKNGSEILTDFNAEYFNCIVDHIVVPSRNELVFHLRNGLCVTERI